MTAYYNEIDKKAAGWLRELIAEGLIAPGHVDERSITDVRPQDLDGYTQCHFFAGVGGWSIAARLAGWPDSRELWSASCPCQPFSVAGKGAGTADARHLWPDFFRLARARRPAFIVGEQVAAAVGKDWFLGVRSDLEGIGYVGRGVVVPACAVNAPHRRDRLWFVAGSRLLENSPSHGDRRPIIRCETHWPTPIGPTGGPSGSSGGNGSNLADTLRAERRAKPEGRDVDHGDDAGRDQAPSGPAGSLPTGDDWPVSDAERQRLRGSGLAEVDGASGAMQGNDLGWERIRPDAGAVRLPGVVDVADSDSDRCPSRIGDGSPARHRDSPAAKGELGHWAGARWLIGHDGKARRVEPSIPLLVDGLPARAPLLRGYGNAIVPQLAAEVIGAWLDLNP